MCGLACAWLKWGDGGSALSPVGHNFLDGCLVPLGTTATHDSIRIPKSLWARWKPPGATMNLYKMIGMNT